MSFNPYDAPKVADSFPELCQGRFNVERLLYGGHVLTAEEWPVWTDPKPMLDECEGKDRKLRLLACASARRVWDQISIDLFHKAIEIGERFADGEATDEERVRVKEACDEILDGDNHPGEASACARCAVSTNASTGAWNSCCTGGADAADLIREIFGNPLQPVDLDRSWLTDAVLALAKVIYEERRYDEMPILADALEEAGCRHAEILNHCRSDAEHVRGCWVVDLLLDKK